MFSRSKPALHGHCGKVIHSAIVELFCSYQRTIVVTFVEETKAGYIRGSVNIPLSLFIDSGTKQMKSADAIRAVFKEAGVDLDTVSIVAMCGHGELC